VIGRETNLKTSSVKSKISIFFPKCKASILGWANYYYI
jgi:hypothetical protein